MEGKSFKSDYGLTITFNIPSVAYFLVPAPCVRQLDPITVHPNYPHRVNPTFELDDKSPDHGRTVQKENRHKLTRPCHLHSPANPLEPALHTIHRALSQSPTVIPLIPKATVSPSTQSTLCLSRTHLPLLTSFEPYGNRPFCSLSRKNKSRHIPIHFKRL